MDFHDKESTEKGSIFSETPEPIFENVVAEKFPQEYEQLKAEEVPAEITTAQDVDRPAPDVLQSIPAVAHEHRYRLFFIIATVGFFVVVLLILLFVVQARRGGGAASQEPVTLTYWGLWEDEQILKPVFDKYKKAHPNVSIVYEKRDPKGYLTYLNGRIANNVGPDIFRFHNTWTNHLSQQNMLAPLPADIYPSAEYEKNFHRLFQYDLKVANRYYGIPLYIDGLVMLYNPEILRSAGVAAPPVSLVGDFPDIVRQVTTSDQTGLRTAGVAMGNGENVAHYSDIFAMIFLLNVLDNQENANSAWARSIIKQTVQDTASHTLGGEALQIVRGFEENGYWNASMPNSIDAFAQGKVAFIFAPTWQIPVIMAKNRDLVFGVAPVPQGLGGKKISIANYWVEGVSARSKNQVEAWKLLRFMSERENLELIFKNQQQTRGMGMAYPRSDMKQLLSDHPQLAALASEIDYLVSVPFVDQTRDGSINDGVIEYIKKALGAASSGAGYNDAFSSVTQGILAVLNQYHN